MKEGGEEWETKGFTVAVGWDLVEQGGYVLVVRITVSSNDMSLEEFRLHLRELEVIEICTRWGIFPM
jgi:hypothetical protein